MDESVKMDGAVGREVDLADPPVVGGSQRFGVSTFVAGVDRPLVRVPGCGSSVREARRWPR